MGGHRGIQGEQTMKYCNLILVVLAAMSAVLRAQLPVITNQPVSQAVWEGANVTFPVAVSGAGPFTYQWRLNETNLPNSIITTVAGGGVNDGSAATNANLWSPSSVVKDAAGNLYIADRQNHRIRKVNTDGIITTVAGIGVAGYSGDGGPATNASLNLPYAVAFDANGNLFIADSYNNRIRKMDTNGVITTVVGNGTGAFFGDGGTATNASLSNPCDVRVDTFGNLLIVDNANARIRKLGANGIITTVAGNGTNAFYGDGSSATNASLNYPLGVAVDASGNLYIADAGNQRIRKVGTNGIIVTLAGIGTYGFSGDGGPATNANLWTPVGMALDASGNLYIGDNGSSRIRAVGTNGIITTVVGGGTNGFGDGLAATNASLFSPNGVLVDPSGNLFIADTGDQRIRKVDSNGIISTVAGNGTLTYSGDGGPVLNASLGGPTDVTVDFAGNLLIADSGNARIRKVSTNGIITTIAGGGTNSPGDGLAATNARLNSIYGVALDALGNLFISTVGDARIHKMSTNGIITTIAGNGTNGYSGDGEAATNASMYYPQGLAVDPAGNVFVADETNQRIRKIGTNGIITTVAGNGSGNYGIGTYSGDGGPATNAGLNAPYAVAVDALSNLFIADLGNCRVRKVNASGTITTFAGNGTSGFSGDGGAATNASFKRPAGVTVDASSNLFIGDDFNERIRQVSANGIVTTVAGSGAAAFSGDGGAATNASLNRPRAMALDAAGNLFIADLNNYRIRKVSSQSGPTLALNNAAVGNEGSYQVVVTGPGGSVTSGVATLIVASSPLIYGTIRNPNGSMTLSLVSPPASTNVLSWTTNITSPIVWKPLSTNVAAANGDWQYTDTNTATYRARFYRSSTP
jgi:sugar lactone lactonase YvrE